MNMNKRLLIEWINEGEDGYFRIYDRATKKEIKCSATEVNETIWKILGV